MSYLDEQEQEQWVEDFDSMIEYIKLQRVKPVFIFRGKKYKKLGTMEYYFSCVSD